MIVVLRTTRLVIQFCAVIDVDQALPFHRSSTPTFAAVRPPTQSRPWYETSASGACSNGGAGSEVHAVPFHVRTTGVSVLPDCV